MALIKFLRKIYFRIFRRFIKNSNKKLFEDINLAMPKYAEGIEKKYGADFKLTAEYFPQLTKKQ